MDNPMPAEVTRPTAMEDVVSRLNLPNGPVPATVRFERGKAPTVALDEADPNAAEHAALRAGIEGVAGALNQVDAKFEARLSVLEAVPVPTKPYVFKKLEEGLWAAGTAMAAVLFQALENPEAITNFRTYIIALGIACLRAGVGAIMSKKKAEPPAGTPVSVDGAARGFTTGAR